MTEQTPEQWAQETLERHPAKWVTKYPDDPNECDECEYDWPCDAAIGARHVLAMAAALEEIQRGAGAFSYDPLEHAGNCIEDMKAIARAALAGEGRE